MQSKFIYVNVPKEDADIINAIHDVVVSAKKNDLVVYYTGPALRCRKAVLRAASGVSAKLGHLVQVPLDRSTNPSRRWNYCIQRA